MEAERSPEANPVLRDDALLHLAVPAKGPVLTVSRLYEKAKHEALEYHTLKQSNAVAVLAIHNTNRGPSLGGIRFVPGAFSSLDAAAFDVLRLAEGMTYKAAVAGLNLGGGKLIIYRDARLPKLSVEGRDTLFQELGTWLNSRGKIDYIPAEDSGTTVDDMVSLYKTFPYVCGRSNLAGDPSPATAEGVAQGIRAALAAHDYFHSPSLSGVHVVIIGVGHVGAALAQILAGSGARLTITDVNQELVDRVASETGANVVAPDDVYDVNCDVLAPCALSGAINSKTCHRINAKIVAGAANAQLESPDLEAELRERGILWAPDFVINAGGLIRVSTEVPHVLFGKPWNPEKAREEEIEKIASIHDTLAEIFETAKKSGDLPGQIAIELAKKSII